MTAAISRRVVLGGLGAGAAQLLFRKRIFAADIPARDTGQPGDLDLSLTALTPGMLRISIAPVRASPPVWELGVVERPSPRPLEPPGPPRAHALPWGRYRIEVSEDPLRIGVSGSDGKLLQEIRFDTDSTAVHFQLGRAPLFGLGEGVPAFDLRQTKDPMINGQHSPGLATFGARVPIPWLISPEGWGLFIGQPSGSFDFTEGVGHFGPVEATSTRNVYLMLGDTPGDILREYAELTGFPHMPPLWSLGFQQSHRTLASREEVLGIAKTFRDKQLPCDVLIYLGTGFCPSGWNTGHGSFTFNSQVFPDPADMFAQLHEEHFRVALHVVPPGDFHGKITDTGSAASSAGDAVTYWAKHLPVESIGVDGWWPDEGDRLSVYARFDRNQMYWDGPVSVHPERRPFSLNRNGYAGVQRFGWLWSGDVESRWETLAAQVMVGIHAGLSGIPYWGTDTGGFNPTSELTPELYVRWFQFSSFCPLFRAHGRAWKLRLPWGWNMGEPGPLEGSDDGNPGWPREQDLHDPEVEEICRKYLNLRYKLLPYLYSSVAQSHATGLPIMRALWIGYPRDEKALASTDVYMWGDHILAAPVIEKGAKQRTTYLPAGKWWDFWSETPVEGGKDNVRAVTLDTMPLFVKAGAIIPIGPVKQYAMQAIDQPVRLRIYPGADGSFAWYDDDGLSFRYEHGEFTRIACAWMDRDRTLTLSYDPEGKPASGKNIEVAVLGSKEAVAVTLKSNVTRIKL